MSYHNPLPSASSNENSNAKPPIALPESATNITHESEPTLDQHPKTSSSRPTSASAMLLNKLANKVTKLQCVDALRARQSCTSNSMQSISSSPTPDIIWVDDLLSSEHSGENYNANMEYPLSDYSDAFSDILPGMNINNPALKNMGSKLFASFSCMDALDDGHDNLPLPGPPSTREQP
ncbi:hypothetical protein COLO4_36906 [Corchorus olitorius]|uniref:Uncharacterized protein n=1 Tax=Corchorus olitorius TaxID=93759 RepID=A0A1R3G4F9_9ROSI|nr:hypothetical protein COLO4_36906 [Corchorus olitorius]